MRIISGSLSEVFRHARRYFMDFADCTGNGQDCVG